MPTATLYNPTTNVTATPTATTTPAQQAAAQSQGFNVSIAAPTAPVTYSMDNLTPGKALSVPTTIKSPNDSTNATALATTVGADNTALMKTMAADQAKAVEESKVAKSGSTDDLTSLMKQMVDVQTSRPGLEETAGLPKLAQQSTEIANKIDARTKAIRDNIDFVEKNFQGTVEGKNAEVARLNREGASELADLAILQNATNRNVATATSLIDRKINLQLEPLKTKLDFTKTFYEDNKADLTKEEDRAFQLKIKEADTLYNETKTAKKELEDEKLKWLGYAVDSKASLDVMHAIQSATTPQDIPLIAAKYGISSKTGVAAFTPTQVADGAVRAGVNQETFNGYSTDVKAFFTQTNDTNIQPIKDALTAVATGKQKAADFNKTIDGMSLAPSVKDFLKAQAAEAEKKAPPPQPGFFSRLWNNLF